MRYCKICFGWPSITATVTVTTVIYYGFPFSTLNCPKDKSSFRFLTSTIENHIYTHCANRQPEQEQEERNCKTKHDSKLCTFANLVPRVSHLGGKMRDPGNEVVLLRVFLSRLMYSSRSRPSDNGGGGRVAVIQTKIWTREKWNLTLVSGLLRVNYVLITFFLDVVR